MNKPSSKTGYIDDFLAFWSEEESDKPAVITSDRSLSFSELEVEVMNMAGYVTSRVEGTQQIVAILLPNSWQFIVAYLGVLRAGHIAMPLDPTFKKLELDSIASQMNPSFLITNKDYEAEITDSLPHLLLGNTVPEAPSAIEVRRGESRTQIASLLFTSGTTGAPKATSYTHFNHLWNIQAVSELWEWSHNDTILLSLPLSHWHGLVMGVSGALYHGNTIYLHERFSPVETFERLESGDISLFMHVPLAYHKLLHHEPTKPYNLSKVRLFVSGSSYLPPAVWDGFQKRFGVEILERYGSSEFGIIASNKLGDREAGSVGYPLPEVETRIEESGELAMRSPGLFPGYFGNNTATAERTTDDGWWLTGDIAEMKGERLILKGRTQERLKKLGYTVYPRDVEWAVMKQPGVRDMVVVGMPGDITGDRIVYFVVGDITEESLKEHCKKNLPAAWRPDKIVIIDEIPRTRSGKARIAELKSRL